MPSRLSRRRPRAAERSTPRWRGILIRTAVLVVPLGIVGALAEAATAVVAGNLADSPNTATLLQFAALVVGTLVTGASVVLLIRRASARGEALLRSALVRAVFRRPLSDLQTDGVGALLDRIDEDPRELRDVVSQLGVGALQAGLGAVVAWVVAGVTWWPAWFAFPIVAVLVLLSGRRVSRGITERQRAAEAATSDHVSHFEEAVAARDDLRTSLGRPFALRGFAERAAKVVALRTRASKHVATAVLVVELLVYSLVITVVLGGTAAVTTGALPLGSLVTLWLLTTGFVRHLGEVASMLPRLDQGLGTLSRVRSLLSSTPEPDDGAPLPGEGAPEIRFNKLVFTYEQQDGPAFTLGPLSFTIPAGSTCALVGRTGSGKTTLTKFLSRAVEPPPHTVLVGGQDVLGTELASLRGSVGLVGQRTELLAASLRDNITMFTDVTDAAVERAVDALGLRVWVASFPDGLDTVLGPEGVTLSAGEQQLVAFARLLVRDVRVVVLDEATARMDPATAERVTHATRALLAGRTGIVVAHRLATVRHADSVAVLHEGRLVEHGPWAELAASGGRFARLVQAAGQGDEDGGQFAESLAELAPRRAPGAEPAPRQAPGGEGDDGDRDVTPPLATTGELRVSLLREAWDVLAGRAKWFTTTALVWGAIGLLGLGGVVSSAMWAALVAALEAGGSPWPAAVGVTVTLIVAALIKRAVGGLATRTGWDATMRVRLSMLRGQLAPKRLTATPPGEVTARAQEQWRLVGWSMSQPGLITATLSLVVLGLLTGSWLAAAIGIAVVACSAGAAMLVKRWVTSAAKLAGDLRAAFGSLLGSALDSVGAVKLSAATPAVVARLAEDDDARVRASLREDQISFVAQFSPIALCQLAIVAAWTFHVSGWWSLATTLLVTTAVFGFAYLGGSLGWVLTSAPSARRWLEVASDLAGGSRLARVAADANLITGSYARSAEEDMPHDREPLRELRLTGVTVTHDDGTVGVQDVDLTIGAGELVLVVGSVGSGKSSLLSAVVGLARATALAGEPDDLDAPLTWNGRPVDTAETFMRPPHVAYVAQVPHIVSGTITENVELDVSERAAGDALNLAQMSEDVAAAGGPEAVVGHRGLRLSGGQVQRLALARALATGSDLLVVDDVSSALDSHTEELLWDALTSRGLTVLGTTSRRATLLRADRVLVLDGGRPVAVGSWAELEGEWGHLAA